MAQAADRTVFVVDDDAAALDSLVMLLRSDGLNPSGFSSAIEFLDVLRPDARGCIISDVRMPGMDGVELVRALKERHCLMPVILITGHADVTVAVQAMKAGAAEFVQKPFESELILRLVRACLEENDDAVDASSRRLRVLRRIESLTAREHQVLGLIMEGASNKLIASSLDISPRTVEIYRANVMSKMRADSLSDLIRMTLAAGAA
ncbi:response regulator transcription factor [Phenylobacterium sp.]|uniref:response regulator transcription factor n=1 Tax=Phenylobacterium sp. TaxID=1871053 RepID=UPI002CA44B76|nr:response regulator [Phenylobacterium sp.]HLZ77193.1 response regulator [Phenylobacterium sp.]